MATAVASPPPMQSDATPFLRSYFSSAFISVTMMRAPDAPTPSDIAHALRTRRMMPPVLCRR